jgi:hypothetical protein
MEASMHPLSPLYTQKLKEQRRILELLDAGKFTTHSNGQDTTDRSKQRARDAIATFERLLSS